MKLGIVGHGFVGTAVDHGFTKDVQKLATKRQSLRWVLIDGVSMISAQLVGVLDILIGKVTWKRNSWKRRADGTERPFGGLKVVFFGDFSQLKPVSGTALASEPELAVGSNATHGSNGVWDPSGRRWRNKRLAWRLLVCAGSRKLVVGRTLSRGRAVRRSAQPAEGTPQKLSF